VIRDLSAALAAVVLFAPLNASAPVPAVRTYDHVLVIVEENKGYRTILDGADAPNLARLARTYGSATQMYAETHPSEGNYVALLGGDTFGIHDDDAWYCVPRSTRPSCGGAERAGYVPHLIDAPNLASELRASGRAWRAYLENIPEPGSLAIFSAATASEPAALYAAKHTGFTNFASVHRDPDLARELVGFDALDRDLAAGSVPAFALIVPNQCNEMHGINSPLAPSDCRGPDAPLVRRGDAHAGAIVDAVMRSPVWTSPRVNTAIVITWDEDGKADRVPGAPQSCCVVDDHNPGGGRIPTIVVTNHGPRGVSDPTPYDHYSLLRTIEDALGLETHAGHAGDARIVPMLPLFGAR
jgi:hypothetical protein